MPLIGIIIGGIDFTSLSITLGDANIMYGNFIQNIVNFLIVAFCIFMVIKFINKLNEKILTTYKINKVSMYYIK